MEDGMLKGGRIVYASVMAMAAGLLAAAPGQAQAGGSCAALAGSALGDHGTIESGTPVAADAAKGLPAYCEIKAWLTPATGSRIGLVYRLPENWNGKILGLGGGGWAGNITLLAAQPGLSRGYATAQTDGGHPGTSPWDNKWAANPESVKDFSYRAIHEMTLTAKQLVQTYYGKPQAKTYYQGCSTGGRMGLMEAQRFPTDYDGIIAGAPVYSLQVQTSSLLRNQMFQAAGAGFTKEQFSLVQSSVLKACGGDKAGYLDDPRACKWNPKTIECKNGATGGCISPAQAAALRTAYAGIRAPDGSWAAFPLMRGGEEGWSLFIATAPGQADATGGGGMIGLKPLLFGDAPVDPVQLTTAQVVTARSSAFAKTYEATNPDVTGFTGRGGKLILWHGESDPGPSPVGTIDYYQAVAKAHPDAAKNVRLFLTPGTGHCGGGPGLNRPDALTALEQWVEQGQAPATLIATHDAGPVTRPLCPFPALARFGGTGDVNDPKNYRCS
jgi:feruloyl esterase